MGGTRFQITNVLAARQLAALAHTYSYCGMLPDFIVSPRWVPEETYRGNVLPMWSARFSLVSGSELASSVTESGAASGRVSCLSE